jgi:hypothetical protein
VSTYLHLNYIYSDERRNNYKQNCKEYIPVEFHIQKTFFSPVYIKEITLLNSPRRPKNKNRIVYFLYEHLLYCLRFTMQKTSSSKSYLILDTNEYLAPPMMMSPPYVFSLGGDHDEDNLVEFFEMLRDNSELSQSICNKIGLHHYEKEVGVRNEKEVVHPVDEKEVAHPVDAKTIQGEDREMTREDKLRFFSRRAFELGVSNCLDTWKMLFQNDGPYPPPDEQKHTSPLICEKCKRESSSLLYCGICQKWRCSYCVGPILYQGEEYDAPDGIPRACWYKC